MHIDLSFGIRHLCTKEARPPRAQASLKGKVQHPLLDELGQLSDRFNPSKVRCSKLVDEDKPGFVLCFNPSKVRCSGTGMAKELKDYTTVSIPQR